ncbi:MAG: GHKL domain-containing protein, partial [Clostridia bacterium]|nr:GHKL domain-containing protein [Clostridia bacterium]
SYFAIYYFYAKTMGKVKILNDVYSTSTLLTFIICLLLIVVIKSVANPFEPSSKVLFIMINIGIFIVGINVLGVQFHMTKTMSVRREAEMVLHIKDLRLAQYENIKQSMAIINEKTHDLKHQLIALKKNYSIDESYMNDIEQAMQIYDTMINTGNKALDVVISDKKLISSKKGIEISVIADGSKLSFMSDANIYSIFGNALDNAIEYLDKVDEKNRTIKVNVQGQGKMVSISVRNYYEGEPVKSEKGLKTSKDNEQWHGFGIKSIKKIAESYGGSLVVYSEDKAFILSILITA